MRIGLMVLDVSPFDAVGNDVVGMYRALKAQGHECWIFTLSGETRYPMRVYHYADAPLILSDPSDILIFHYCVLDPTAIKMIRQSRARVVLKYHNLTPPHFFAPYNRDFSLHCKQARDGLREVCRLPLIWALSDSQYNTDDLNGLLPAGVGRSVVPPFHQTAELLGSADHPETKALLDGSWFNILNVGRVVPNKATHLMMPALAALRDKGIKGVRVHIVGSQDPRLAEYLGLIESGIAQYDLRADIVMHRSISTEKLATLYRHCDLLWITSQHEGFCVPAIEAMASGLPVLTTRQSALPETCGDAALYADDTDEMAEQLFRLVTDDTLRSQFRTAGERRYRELFSDRAIEDRFLAEIDRIASMPPVQAADDDAEWFGFPLDGDIEQLSEVAASHGAPVLLASEDGRRGFADWLVRNEATGIWPEAGLRVDSLRAFAARLDVPGSAAYFDAPMRFAWHFNPDARALFRLQSNADIAAFSVWYRETGATQYETAFGGRRT